MMVWGPIIAMYLFLAGAGAGAFIWSAFLEHKFPEARKTRFAGRCASIVLIAVGLVLLMIDARAGLMHPLRFVNLIMNPGSVMTWGVYFICVFMVITIIVVVLEWRGKKVPWGLVIAGCVLGLCVAAYTGFLLGVVAAYPLWNNTVLPLLFVASALGAGLAVVSLAGLILEREQIEKMEVLKTAHVVIAITEIVFLAAMLFIVANGNQAGIASVRSIMAGNLAPLFWVGLVVIGLVGPLAIELFGKERAERFPVAVGNQACVLVGGFLLRFIVVAAALPIALI